jgi:hypothetical protein
LDSRPAAEATALDGDGHLMKLGFGMVCAALLSGCAANSGRPMVASEAAVSGCYRIEIKPDSGFRSTGGATSRETAVVLTGERVPKRENPSDRPVFRAFTGPTELREGLWELRNDSLFIEFGGVSPQLFFLARSGRWFDGRTHSESPLGERVSADAIARPFACAVVQ